MKEKKKIIIIMIIILVIIGIIVGVICCKNRTTNTANTEKEVIEIINNLNSGKGSYGDWKKDLYITNVKEVKKINIDLLDEDEKDGLNKTDSMFIMKLEEKTYGDIQIIVTNGEVTGNSILGETFDELWDSNIFTKDKIDVNRIMSQIEK
jgi:ABC-type cobalt transport system substrate-binding protein